MKSWVSGVATFGLVCLMIIPQPGILGIVIGGVCALAIIISAVMLVLDHMAARLIVWGEQFKTRRRANQRRASLHAGSGMAKKAPSTRR